MGHKCVLRAEKLGTRGNVGGSAAHNYREMETLNADPRLAHLNIHNGASSKAELLALMDARIAELDEVDPQAVPLVELLVTAGHSAFKEFGGHVDYKSYFSDSLDYFKDKFGEKNVIASTIHLDEFTPHLVVYIVPAKEVEARERKRSVIVGRDADGNRIRETRTYQEEAKTVLSAKHYLGTRAKLSAFQTDFAAKVGAKHGLERGIKGSKARHQTVQQYYSLIQAPLKKVPKPPVLSGVDLLNPNKKISEYTSALSGAVAPIYAKARQAEVLKSQVNKADDYVNRTAELERELEQLNAKNRQLAANFAELQQNYSMLYAKYDSLEEGYERLESQLKRSKAAEVELLSRLEAIDPTFDRLTLSY